MAVFLSVKELLSGAESAGLELWEYVLRASADETGISTEHSWAQMAARLEAMKKADSSYDAGMRSHSGLTGGDGVALLLEPCAENAALHLRAQLRHFYVLFHSFSLSAASAASIFCLVFTSASPSARRSAPAQAHGRSRRSRPGQGVRRSEAPARRKRRGWEREFARRRQCPSGRGRIR